MRYENCIRLCGNLGADPVLRTLPNNGPKVATFSMATKDSWRDGKGEWQSRTDWHNVEVFGRQVDEVMTYKQGCTVSVKGKSRNDRVPKKDTDGFRTFHKVFAVSVMQVVRPPRTAGEDHDATDSDGSTFDDQSHAAWLAEFDKAETVGSKSHFS